MKSGGVTKIALLALCLGLLGVARAAIADGDRSPIGPAQLSLGSGPLLHAVGASYLGQPEDEPAVDKPAEEDEVISEETTIETTEVKKGRDLKGPYFLRSADPEEVGEIELKLIYGYATTSGASDENEIEFELEWGFAENWEYILELPVELGNGRVEGNADITTGFHTRLWKQSGLLPAFALRNMIRIPNGYYSSGVDYTARGLVTWALDDAESFRIHLNPWLKLVNGHIENDARHFQWGTAIGFDWMVTDNFVFVMDYHHRSSEVYGNRNNHSLEFGADWKLAEHHSIGLQTEVGLDGDDEGPNWGMRVSYILSLPAPHLGG